MKPVLQPYQAECDYWRIRGFLRGISLLNGRHDYAWSLLRWDYWRWHVNENIYKQSLPEVISLWEEEGQIVAVLNPDMPGEAFFQVHPAFREKRLLSEMLDVAEEKLSKTNVNGNRELLVWVNEADETAKELFSAHGYTRSKYLAEHMRRRFFTAPVSAPGLPAGYTIRALGDEHELPARSWLSWKVFHPEEPDANYQGWEWYRNVQRVPLYRRDLDIVAVAPDGVLAAFCTVWFDDVTRTAVFEPVGTHPGHQKRGLGKAVMAEGLRRAEKLGATLATVSSYGKAAHALYDSMGFTDVDLLEPWMKES